MIKAAPSTVTESGDCSCLRGHIYHRGGSRNLNRARCDMGHIPLTMNSWLESSECTNRLYVIGKGEERAPTPLPLDQNNCRSAYKLENVLWGPYPPSLQWPHQLISIRVFILTRSKVVILCFSFFALNRLRFITIPQFTIPEVQIMQMSNAVL